uniref:KIAA1217 n=1 Tax=Ornithorhynchus anatinus TaxID=9258 RepID=A0A6I8PDF4_ORNAN
MEEHERQKSQAGSAQGSQVKDQGKSNLHVTSLEDAACRRTKEPLANGSPRSTVPKHARNLSRRYTVGGPRSSKEILGLQTSEMDRKREAFLEHLKQKYPHHATAIMGHQERLRDQEETRRPEGREQDPVDQWEDNTQSSGKTRSPKLCQSPQPASSGDQAEHLSEASADSLDAMSEGEAPSPFSRGSRTRASLPVVRSTNQTKERSLGVLYLQYGDETKQLRMPNAITSADTIRALFVSAFPQQLTMKILESPSVAIYIKDESRNIYYELSDVRNIQDRSFLKVYNKDPAHAFNHTTKTVNGDVRMQREIAYARGDGAGPSRPGSHANPTSPPSTPVAHSMPPSPSRIPYGGVRSVVVPGNATLPRDRLSSMPVSRSVSPSPSAILERRDVKPDEDLSGKNLALFRNEGLYADPYLYHEARMSIASAHTGHPLDVPDHVIAYHRTAIRSASAYCSPSMQAELMEQSLYRQKSRKYPDSHLPTLGSKTPPASPHRVADIRMMDLHPHPNALMAPHALPPDRASPSRQSFKKELGPVMYVESKAVRNPAGLPVVVDVIEKPAFGYGTMPAPKDKETRDRMQAMEKQIASLTGLVQSALFKGPNTSNSKDASSEKMGKAGSSRSSTDSAGATVSGAKSPLPVPESAAVRGQTPPVGSSSIQVSLHDMRRNVAELKIQLHQMRQLQLQNQELLRAMMKKAELEINGKVIETVKKLEDPVQRQRVLVEQERQKYLREEERIVKKLCELEQFVEDLKKDSSWAGRAVTLKDVEDGAFLLRQVGEAVATLKGEFPSLQNKMRAVLRIEVEAVRFLKEEPHKLDSLLKRVRSMTDVLTALRRHVTEELLKGADPAQAAQYAALEKATAAEILRHQEESGSPLGRSSQNPPSATGEATMSTLKTEAGAASSGSAPRAPSSPALSHPPQPSVALAGPSQNPPAGGGRHPSSPPDPGQDPQALPSPQAPASGSTVQNLFIEEIHSASASTRSRAVSIEKAERKWEEKRQNLGHYNGKEFEKLLEEAQANLLKSIPNLEMPPQAAAQAKGDVVDKADLLEEGKSEQECDKLGKAPPPPPPPPPRRSYLPGSGLTTTRSGDVVYTVRKETIVAKESKEDTGQVPQPKVSRCSTEEKASARALPAPPVTGSSAKDEEEEEEEGDRIMAELQAFQKCSFMDVNSNSHVEQSRTDSHVKDSSRPVALIHPKEKKNWEILHEDAQKSEVAHESDSPVEFRMVGGVSPGPLKVSNSPKDKRENEPEENTAEREKGDPNKSLLRENKASLQKGRSTVNASLSGIGAAEDGVSPGQPHPVVEAEQQKTSFGKMKEMSQPALENLAKCSPASRPPEPRTQELSKASKSSPDHDVASVDYGQVVLRPKGGRTAPITPNEEADSTASSPTEESPPSDNIAFMITKTAVQVLSSGEVRDIVSRQGGDVQTVNIDAKKEATPQPGGLENEDPVVCLDKKPVIIIFDEPMDIRSAYKRLSTIFEECDEELERMMTEEKIEEEEEEEEDSEELVTQQRRHQMPNKRTASGYSGSTRPGKQPQSKLLSHPTSAESRIPRGPEASKTDSTKDGQVDPSAEGKPDQFDDQFGSAKKKFKFKFPKKQLAALTQAIRTGTKTGKKTLQVVVYEEEEEDGTLKQHKEAKRFEISRSQPEEMPKQPSGRPDASNPECLAPASRTDEIRKNTYRTLDSLEQTIKQLENTISEMSPKTVPDSLGPSARGSLPCASPLEPESSSRALAVAEETSAVLESPPPIPSSSRKGPAGTPPTSRMPVPMSSKTRPGSLDKPAKQPKLQDPRQYRQANGSAKKAGGDCKTTSPPLPASKIPAFSPSSGKSSPLPASSDSSCSPLPPPHTKSSIPPANLLSPATGRAAYSSSLIPSVSNGSLKFQNPPHLGKGHHLAFPLQTQNGRPSPPSSTSSPPSPASPTSLTPQSVKSIRTLHTPSFTNYKSQNGNASKSTAKESA